MIEKIILDYLTENLDEKIFLEHQNNMPASYIIFEKTGSSQKNHLKSAVFAFQSYADSLYNASLLNEKLKSTVLTLDKLSEISGVYLNSDYNFTDTTTKKYRYQAVFNINYY